MERLQEALSRARSRRENAAQGTGSAETPAAGKPAARRSNRAAAPDAATTRAAWEALPQYTPNERALRSNRIFAFSGGQDGAAYDMLRTKVLQQLKSNGWKRIVVTSPTPRCGKTTITANLAFSLARQQDLRTLVVEADMRRPELAKMLGIKKNCAFARVLSGQEPASDHMLAYGNNLALGTNQVPAANSSELLHSAMAREQIEALEKLYAADVVLFDAAPMMASDDTVGFLDFADAALIVAAAEQTSIDEVDVTEQEVAASTNVLGVVLNKSRYTRPSYGYEEGYY